MTAGDSTLDFLPVDPTFPPAVYERTALLLRIGVVGFFVLATVGMIAGLLENPSQTVETLVGSNAGSAFGSVGSFLSDLGVLQPSALVTLGIFVLVAVTVGRVLYATVDLYRGRERLLAGLAGAVIVMLIVGLFVIAPFVR